MSKKKELNKSQILIDSAAYFIMISSALYIATGMTFPIATPLTLTKTSPEAKPSSSWFSDRVQQSVPSNTVQQPKKATNAESTPTPVAKKNIVKTSSSTHGQAKKVEPFSIWSILASNDDDDDDEAVTRNTEEEKKKDLPVVNVAPSPAASAKEESPEKDISSSILLQGNIEKKIINMLGSVFVDDEESPESASKSSWGSMFVDSEDVKGEKIAPTTSVEGKEEENGYASDFVYTWFANTFFAADEEEKISRGSQQNMAKKSAFGSLFASDDFEEEEEDHFFFASSSPPKAENSDKQKSKTFVAPKVTKKQVEDIPKDNIDEGTEKKETPESLLNVMKTYESLLKLQKTQPGVVSPYLLEILQSKIDSLIAASKVPEPEKKSTNPKPEEPIVFSASDDPLNKWTDSNPVSPTVEKVSPIFAEFMNFLKKQLSFDARFAANDDTWDDILVQDNETDSPFESYVLVEEKKKNVKQQKQAASKNEQPLFDRENVKQQKQAASKNEQPLFDRENVKKQKQAASKNEQPLFDWDSVLVGKTEESDDGIESLLAAPRNTATAAKPTPKTATKPSPKHQTQPSKKTELQKLIKQLILSFDWDKLFVDGDGTDSPIDDILAQSAPEAQSANQELKNSEERGGVSFDWSNVLVEDFDSDEPLANLLAEEHDRTKPKAAKLKPPVPKQQRKTRSTKGVSFDWDGVLVHDPDTESPLDRVLVDEKKKDGNKQTAQEIYKPNSQPSKNNFNWENVLAPEKETESSIEKILSAERKEHNTKETRVVKQRKPFNLRDIFVFSDDTEEDPFLAPTPVTTTSKKIRGFDWDIFPTVYRAENVEEKQQAFIKAKKEMGKTVKEGLKNVKGYRFDWNIAPKVYKSSPDAAEKARKDYKKAKAKMHRALKSVANKIFGLFQ